MAAAPGERARTQRTIIASGLAALVLLAVGVSAVHKQVRDGNDFPIYWQAARALLSGQSPYDVGSGLHGYVYLPWFALLLGPLALLPLAGAAACWYAINVAFLWLAGRALLDTIGMVAAVPRARVLVLATLPFAGLLHDNLVLGQANLLLLLLVAATAQGALRPRGNGAHGMALGLATALKMPAGLVLLPLLLRGHTRAILGCLLGATLALALPFITTGAPFGGRLLGEWQQKVVAPAAAGTLQGSKIIDQSPHAALRRLLVDEPAYSGHAVNVAALDPVGFARVSRTAAAVLFAGYLLVWFAAPARGTRRALALDLALGCCAMVQVTGFSLKAQFVVLLLPAWLAATLAWNERARTARILLMGAGVLFLVSQPGVSGRPLSNLLLAYSAMTFGTLLLTTAVVVLRFATRNEPARAREECSRRTITPPPSGGRTGAPGAGTTR